jgi:hypothetical protein
MVEIQCYVYHELLGTHCARQEDRAEAEEDLEAACNRSLAHGSLLALRYLAPALPWAQLAVRARRAPAPPLATRLQACLLTAHASSHGQ